jgi:hypothetical protein
MVQLVEFYAIILDNLQNNMANTCWNWMAKIFKKKLDKYLAEECPVDAFNSFSTTPFRIKLRHNLSNINISASIYPPFK